MTRQTSANRRRGEEAEERFMAFARDHRWGIKRVNPSHLQGIESPDFEVTRFEDTDIHRTYGVEFKSCAGITKGKSGGIDLTEEQWGANVTYCLNKGIYPALVVEIRVRPGNLLLWISLRGLDRPWRPNIWSLIPIADRIYRIHSLAFYRGIDKSDVPPSKSLNSSTGEH